MKKRSKMKQRPKKWCVVNGEVVERAVTVDGEHAFVHPERLRSSRLRYGAMKKTALIIPSSLVFKTKARAIRSLGPKPIWWVHGDAVKSGRACLERSSEGTSTVVYDRKNERQYYYGDLYHSRLAAAAGLLKERKLRMLRDKRNFMASRRNYVRAQRLIDRLLSKKARGRPPSTRPTRSSRP